ADVSDLPKSLDELERLLRIPQPNADRVAQAARKVIRQIDTPLLEKLANLRYDAKSLVLAYRRDLENAPRAASKGNWDAASQLYLAIAALDDGKHDPELGPVIRELL